MFRKIILGFLPFYSLLLFAGYRSVAQEMKLLEGQILADSISPSNIHIINLRQEEGTVSDASGRFKIYAKPGDHLLFSSVQFENREVVVTQVNYDTGLMKLNLYVPRNELDEIRITDMKLTGHLAIDVPKIKYFDRQEFGIPYPEERPTQTERRLYTANAGVKSRWSYLGVLFGSVPLDVILNDINGRTNYLRELDKQDKLQLRVRQGIDILGEDFFMLELGIPRAEIENFVYYCARETKFQVIIESGNTLDLIEFYKNRKNTFLNLRKIDEHP